jgi:hypothetical protein
MPLLFHIGNHNIMQVHLGFFQFPFELRMQTKLFLTKDREGRKNFFSQSLLLQVYLPSCVLGYFLFGAWHGQ